MTTAGIANIYPKEARTKLLTHLSSTAEDAVT